MTAICLCPSLAALAGAAEVRSHGASLQAASALHKFTTWRGVDVVAMCHIKRPRWRASRLLATQALVAATSAEAHIDPPEAPIEPGATEPGYRRCLVGAGAAAGAALGTGAAAGGSRRAAIAASPTAAALQEAARKAPATTRHTGARISELRRQRVCSQSALQMFVTSGFPRGPSLAGVL